MMMKAAQAPHGAGAHCMRASRLPLLRVNRDTDR
jgi:hypothetical protein